MKRNIIASLVVAALLCGGSIGVLFAQNVPGKGHGKGYGGLPRSQEERAARQAACPNGGPRRDCRGFAQGNANGQGKACGQGIGNGQGKCARKGLRDGTGPRAHAGTCPNAPAK